MHHKRVIVARFSGPDVIIVIEEAVPVPVNPRINSALGGGIVQTPNLRQHSRGGESRRGQENPLDRKAREGQIPPPAPTSHCPCFEAEETAGHHYPAPGQSHQDHS